ncbi:MAG: hypothetical protein P1V35_03660, partial [Planctomycetota bacterium]|nr:hypothetical protein [Planctomycetota bacterium]
GLAWPLLKPAPKEPMRSARHPRGFKGTKAQPPKPAGPKTFDVLPFLDGGAHEAGVLQALAEYGQPEYGGEWTPENRAAAAQMPEDFQRHFTWVADHFSWDRMARMIPAYWNLELADEPELKRVVASIFHGPGLTRSPLWVEAMVSLSPKRRTAFAELLLELTVPLDSEGDLPSLLIRLDELCTDDNFRNRAHHILTEWNDEAIAWEVLAQFELLNDYWPEGNLGEVVPVLGAAGVVRRAMEDLQGGEDSWGGTGFCRSLLEACGDFEGFMEVLEEAPLKEMGPDVAYKFLCLFTLLYHTGHDWDTTIEFWGYLKGVAPDWIQWIVESPPEYRLKLHGYLLEMLEEWKDPKEVVNGLREWGPWIRRICAGPFVQDARGSYSMCRLVHLPVEHFPAVLAAPERAFVHLEKSARRDNDDSLLGYGLRVLVEVSPDLVVAGLASGTGALASTARVLGSLNRSDALRSVREWLDTKLYQVDPADCPAEELAHLIQAHGGPSAQTLVSRNFRQHLDGSTRLTENQVKRVGSKIRDAWPDVLLGTLAHKVPTLLAERIGADANAMETKENHALRMIFAAEDNRRMLRRVLRHHFAGERDYIRNHPINREWLEEHARLKGSVWTSGFELSKETKELGWLTIELEQDPLEVLRAGTYVGSCLGLGGGFAHSAAAIMMDGNKHVAYCRDRRGVILARQVLVMAEDEKLHCFQVYPLEGDAGIQSFFMEFDRTLAAWLRVPIHDPEAEGEEHAEDRIRLLLSSEWWNDYPMQVPPE